MVVENSILTVEGDDRPSAPTLEQVAERAGVSRSTASRAINGGLRVSPDALAAVEAAVAELGYTPNRAARSLVTKRTDSIALVVPEPDERVLSDPFFAGTLNGLSTSLADSDIQVVLVIARPGESERTVRYLRNGHVDGAIVVSHHRTDDLDRTLLTSRVPNVFVGRPLSVDPAEVHYVDTDNVAGGTLAARHLIERGCRRIATIAGPEDMSAGVDRLAGWRAALDAAGMPTDAVLHGDFTLASGARTARELVEQFPDVDGVFIASDLMAAGALSVFAELGRDVPGDIAVVGYDNIGVAASTTPPLTTIVQPVVSMARAAGSRLLAQLHGEPVSREPLIFAPEIVVRASA
ncbi:MULTISPECIES: LacI family DNA-binding transcriptional regulator [Cellulomonas]|uniref:Transcriptional regulator, LacI family n=1 Tax=Cellulomonas gilvus (strain ATCC 13127 / NRRL B-14078) TaxID=593907 RepID=F8A0U9_CELGA|nr:MULTISPECIES: LacI family DNA-binding transcriptional regulator [Cellulomonas]AEI11571.1 transcriptional regulator, LacI family [Cellulomonas gilvus ATCC 13127]MCR6690572.1 LacI family transcriptional regulator [Cellulomonas sp.]